MLKKSYSQCNYNCEENNIEVYFEYNNSVIFDTVREARDDFNDYKCKELSVITRCELEQNSNLLEINRYSRIDNLIIQGIITFFTGSSLTVYHSTAKVNSITPIEYEKQDIHLKINGVDYSKDLIIILERLKQEPKLIITLLDRWRKAIYLKEESCDADLYHDEATLSFFHILELFGESIATELKNKLKTNIENMLYDYFNSYYFEEEKKKVMVRQNKKSINSLLIGNHLNLSIKIKFFLEKYKLLDDNVAFFIDNIIKVRNEIAHGRRTYQEVFLWPLPPFFSMSKNSYENVKFLSFLSAEMISKYIGISCWEKEWNEVKYFLMPPNHIISDFLEKKLVIDNFNYNMLVLGNKYNITWRTLFNYYVKKPEKKTREYMEVATKVAFINTLIDENNAPDVFNMSIIFTDSDDLDIKQKAIENVKTIISNNWYGWSNFKDAYIYLDYYSVKVAWYEDFLLNQKYL